MNLEYNINQHINNNRNNYNNMSRPGVPLRFKNRCESTSLFFESLGPRRCQICHKYRKFTIHTNSLFSICTPSHKYKIQSQYIYNLIHSPHHIMRCTFSQSQYYNILFINPYLLF